MENIKNLPQMERPGEKLLHFGAARLSNIELIAILLGSGNNNVAVISICRELISAINNQPGMLAAMSIEQLMSVKGIGEAKAVLLVAALELGKRAAISTEPLLLDNEQSIEAFLRPYFDRQTEPGYFLLMLNHKNELLATEELIIIDEKLPAVRQLIRPCLDAGAFAMLLCRQDHSFSEKYTNREKALIIQLDTAASMLNIKMKGLLIAPLKVV